MIPMTDVIVKNVSAPAPSKITARQIETDARLQQLGKEITERLEKARKNRQLAEDHIIAVNARIAEAKKLCDDGGFKKFRELFCPQLGKSQAYALHAIGAGKKTLEQHRNEQRDRQRKSRSNQKSPPANSVTVTEDQRTHNPELHAGGNEPRKDQSAIATSAIASGDGTLSRFSGLLLELVRITDKKRAKRFDRASVSANDLRKLGSLLINVADLKESAVADPAPIVSGCDIAPVGSLQPGTKS
jgi:hypothetical protein